MRGFRLVFILTAIFALATSAMTVTRKHNAGPTATQNGSRSPQDAHDAVKPHDTVKPHNHDHGHDHPAVHHQHDGTVDDGRSHKALPHIGSLSSSSPDGVVLVDWSHIALDDMHTYAVHRLGVLDEHPHSVGSTDQWSNDWDLTWADYSGIDGHIRIYHATSKHDEALRFTTVWHGHGAQYGPWERVH